jgi:hypothetical protein
MRHQFAPRSLTPPPKKKDEAAKEEERREVARAIADARGELLRRSREIDELSAEVKVFYFKLGGADDGGRTSGCGRSSATRRKLRPKRSGSASLSASGCRRWGGGGV